LGAAAFVSIALQTAWIIVIAFALWLWHFISRERASRQSPAHAVRARGRYVVPCSARAVTRSTSAPFAAECSGVRARERSHPI
jgi:hypothetical protein